MSSRLNIELLNPSKNPSTLYSLYDASPFDHLPAPTRKRSTTNSRSQHATTPATTTTTANTSHARSRSAPLCFPSHTALAFTTTVSRLVATVFSFEHSPSNKSWSPASTVSNLRSQPNKVRSRLYPILFSAGNAHRGDSTWRQPNQSPAKSADSRHSHRPCRGLWHLDDTDTAEGDSDDGTIYYDSGSVSDSDGSDSDNFVIPPSPPAYSLESEELWS